MKGKGIQPKKWKLVFVSHSHWDREWYLPFQGFRFRLIGMIDRLLDILASDPNYRCFMLDGQTIAVEDYLEVRPDRRPEIEQRVGEGRLLLGPWYIPPDEFLAGGEAHIRNLLRGIRAASSLGGAMMVGYDPDAFGHIAHLPQIFRGFGIDNAVIWRGLDDRIQKTEFRWQAPDGSEVLTVHMPRGYDCAGGLSADWEESARLLERVRSGLEPRATTSYLLLMAGGDHSVPLAEVPQIVSTANAVLDDAQAVHGSLPELLQGIREEAREQGIDWQTFQGEMRSAQWAPLLPGTLSTRMWIKQRNQVSEDLLGRVAEPFSVWAALLKARLGPDWRVASQPSYSTAPQSLDLESLRGLIGLAWKLLLENQDHDGICGCSVDAVHREMAFRFDACQQAGDELRRLAFRNIATQVNTGHGGIVVFNPLIGPRTDFVTARWLQTGDGAAPAAVVDDAGNDVPFQVLSRPQPRYMSVPGLPPPPYAIGFVASGVPGFGYKEFRVVSGADDGGTPASKVDSIENEFFAVTAEPAEGTFAVLEKATGRLLPGLNRFVDGGDRGDEYACWPPDPDTLVDRPSKPARVSVVESGPARFVLEMRMTYRLPNGLSGNRKERARRTAACPIVTRATLYPGVRRVDFSTEVDNRVPDHRLRVHFPTGIRTDVTHAEQHFGVVTRPVSGPRPDKEWIEEPVATYPQKTFVDVNDGDKGMMLANRGLPEYEALPGKVGVTLALTLLRCVGWLCRGDMETRKVLAGPPFTQTPGAQCLGRHAFEYSLIPHAGGWQNAFAEAHRFAVPLLGRQAAGGGSLPSEGGVIEIDCPEVVLSALKLGEDGDGIIARLYNIDDKPVSAKVRVCERAQQIELVNLNEEKIDDVRVDGDGWVSLAFRPNQIVTLRFRVSLA